LEYVQRQHKNRPGQSRDGNRLGVEDADPRLDFLFETIVDEWDTNDLDTRDIWMQRVRLAASQNGFEFEPALRKFLVHILVDGKEYSALASLKKTDSAIQARASIVPARHSLPGPMGLCREPPSLASPGMNSSNGD
jgi:hypothetical protein